MIRYRASGLELGAHYVFDKPKDIAAFTRLPVELCQDCAVRAARCQAGSA